MGSQLEAPPVLQHSQFAVSDHGKGKCNTAPYKTKMDESILILQVKHSQRMSTTPLLPWVVVEERGEILAAHCTCMAGYKRLM